MERDQWLFVLILGYWNGFLEYDFDYWMVGQCVVDVVELFLVCCVYGDCQVCVIIVV